MDAGRYITIKEAAALLGCSTRTVRRRLKSEPWDSFLDVERGPVPVRLIRESDVLAARKAGQRAPHADQPGQGAASARLLDLTDAVRRLEADLREAEAAAAEREAEWDRRFSELVVALEPLWGKGGRGSGHSKRRRSTAFEIGLASATAVVVGVCILLVVISLH